MLIAIALALLVPVRRRRADRPAAAGRAVRARSGPADAVLEQSQANRSGHAQLPRRSQVPFRPPTSPTQNGRPMHSWRVALLPYLERADLYERYNFNEPWDSPGNLQVAEQMPKTYRCPSSPASAPGSTVTNYVVIVGDPTQPQPQSMFLPNHWTKMSDVTRRNEQHHAGRRIVHTGPLDASRCRPHFRAARIPSGSRSQRHREQASGRRQCGDGGWLSAFSEFRDRSSNRPHCWCSPPMASVVPPW